MAIKLVVLNKIQIPHHPLRKASALRGLFMSFKRDEYVSLRTLTHSHACIGEGHDVGKRRALNGWLVNTTVLFLWLNTITPNKYRLFPALCMQ